MTQLQTKAAEERMFEEAKRAIRASGEFQTVTDLAALLRVDPHGLNQQLNAWKNRRQIFSIHDETVGELFPVFAFDRSHGLRVFEAVPAILKVFGNKLSSWGIAAWFIADCSYLDNQAPKDLAEREPNWVIAAAQDEIDEISHG